MTSSISLDTPTLENDSQTLGTDTSLEDPLSYLPDPPVEPLPSDCCGTGCSPCVMDIYQDELEIWRKLSAMSAKERAAWRRQSTGNKRRESTIKYALSTSDFTPLLVKSIKKETSDSCVYSIALPDGHCLGYQLGQHCILRGFDSTGIAVTRQYTPISPPDREDSFDVLIKLYKDGPMSCLIRDWGVGSVTEWRGMFGGLQYTPNKFKRVGMLACGTGIAPMIQVARAVIENESEDTFVHLVYSCPTQHTIPLKDQLDKYAAYWNFSVFYVLSRTTEQEVKGDPGLLGYGDRVSYGRLDSEVVSREMPEASKENYVLICGTRSFDKDMINYLCKKGYTKDMYHKF